MRIVRLFTALLALLCASGSLLFSATFGTVVPLVGGATDMVLDHDRQRLYFVNVPNQIQVYSIVQRRYLAPIRTDDLPLAAAMSRSGRFLYVTCHNASSINIIDLETLSIVQRVSLPARPEGIAVGFDERVLITTIGTGQNNLQNVLLLYDPRPGATATLSAIPVTPPPPTPPQLSPPSGRVFLTNRSALAASSDGRTIIGLILPNNANRNVFVYEADSGTVIRSRIVTGVSNVLTVAPNGSRFMAGLTLFETRTLEVMAQQNLANAPYPVPAGTNFNTQVNQGGAVFSPNNATLYSAFNVTPVQNPPARANVSQMMINDPDNLLILEGIQLPENLSGKMEMARDSSNIYALSESGFVIIPISTVNQAALARPERTAIALSSDQCALPINQRTAAITVRNAGRGNLGPVGAQLLNNTAAPIGLGGIGGPGGGAPGGGVVILPGPGIPGLPGGGAIQLPGFPGNNNQINAAQNALIAAAPSVRTTQTPDGTNMAFTFSPANARTVGSAAPSDFLVSAPNAVNIPARVRVYQNNRNPETRGDIYPAETGTSNNEGLVDMVYDSLRQRIYIANSGMNRVEVFDARTRQYLAPIKVGQLPRSLALALDNSLLYVANSGGESISVVNPDERAVIGKINYPPIPFNANFALVTPSVLAMSQRGLLVVMNNGTLWRVVGNELVPRSISPIIGTATLAAPRTMASTPNGENVIVMTGNGFVYLYDSLADEFVQGRQIFTTGQTRAGYFGPIAAGPRGQYFLVNGTVLNQSLTPTFTATAGIATAVRPGTLPTAQNAPIPGVVPVGVSNYLRLSMPVPVQGAIGAGAIGGGFPGGGGAAALLQTGGPALELVDINSGFPLRRWDALEGPVSPVSTTQQVNVDGRTLAVDPAGTTAYVLSASGLNVVALDTPTPANERPVPNQNGVVSSANFAPAMGQGGVVSVFGRNFSSATAGSEKPQALLGNVCVTLNNNPLSLFAVAPGQINAQIPFELAPGTYPLVVRSIDKRAAANPTTIRVTKYAPAVFVDSQTKQTAIYHSDGSPVTADKPTTRDRRVTIYATGLGPTRPATLTAQPAPENAITDRVQVFFGPPAHSMAEVVVESSKAVAGRIGIYEIKVYVPGDRVRGKNLPITLRIGGVSSSTTAGLVPTVSVD